MDPDDQRNGYMMLKLVLIPFLWVWSLFKMKD